MREDIISYIENDVKQKCESDANFFGKGSFHHTIAVVNNAEFLAEKYGGDTEVIIIAAWLHDIASIIDYTYYKDHHIHGARIAEEILTVFGYDKAKTELVMKCILNHRGSVVNAKGSIEELIIADADAISHFDSLPSLFYLAYVQKELSLFDGIEFVRSKLERSYNKLSDKSRELYRDKYFSVMSTLG